MLQFGLCAALPGFALGVAIPLARGLWILHDLAAQAAAMPPNMGQCGMPGMYAWCLILFGSPAGGLIGAALGFAAGALYAYVSNAGDSD